LDESLLPDENLRAQTLCACPPYRGRITEAGTRASWHRTETREWGTDFDRHRGAHYVMGLR
jgi:hypothetical protein